MMRKSARFREKLSAHFRSGQKFRIALEALPGTAQQPEKVLRTRRLRVQGHCEKDIAAGTRDRAEGPAAMPSVNTVSESEEQASINGAQRSAWPLLQSSVAVLPRTKLAKNRSSKLRGGAGRILAIVRSSECLRPPASTDKTVQVGVVRGDSWLPPLARSRRAARRWAEANTRKYKAEVDVECPNLFMLDTRGAQCAVAYELKLTRMSALLTCQHRQNGSGDLEAERPGDNHKDEGSDRRWTVHQC
ncbi:hypothetical protein FA15DRAFT_733711 [Coprinopsis marcescibilis]|uniref:Uncharacterized protein n=1 Tax=Coprinopsis marcescibilis TaxID=230819 RepID=A0A5C3LCH8_COPMA|nr:hypothetical protein FA15DRAFT_733711 [Coprinopsis marcescibilis]